MFPLHIKTTTLLLKTNSFNPNYSLLVLSSNTIQQCIDEIIKSLCNILHIQKNEIKKINVFDKSFVNILNFLTVEDFSAYVENDINYAVLYYDVEFNFVNEVLTGGIEM
jgi:hypothetical protein